MNGTKPKGMVLLIDAGGTIQQVIQYPSDWGNKPEPGTLWFHLIHPGSLGKALNFFLELQKDSSTYSWELDFVTSPQTRTLYVSGSILGELFIIIATEAPEDSRPLLDEMLKMHNQQTNFIRQLVKDQAISNSEELLLREISRLNNELVNAQRDLYKKYAELQALNNEKNRLIGIVAHDLRGPLYSIVSLCDFLLEEEATFSEESQNIIRTIQSSCSYMAEMVDTLLDVSKIEAGQLELQYETIDLAQHVPKTLEMLRLNAERKQISLHIRIPGDPCMIQGDSMKLTQVIHNLVGNAIKFTHPGGSIFVTLQDEGNQVRILIRDTGIGIPKDQLTKLFTSFNRGRPGTLGERSTGLGLVIVKRIVAGHGGSLDVESVEGEGTTVIVQIPKAPPTSKADAL